MTFSADHRGAISRFAVIAFFLAASSAAFAQPRLSEIRIDQSGTDDDEYLELVGIPSQSLDGLTYLVIGDNSGGGGAIEAVVSLTGQTIPPSGFFVAAEGTFTLATADLTTDLNFENSDNVTHLLVRDFTGNVDDDLDTDNDGVLDAQPWSALVDCVALVETPGSGDPLYCPTQVGPDTTFVPGHTYYCPGTWEIGAFQPVGTDDTPGAANPCDAPAVYLNEVRVAQAGDDVDEFFELSGPPATDLSALTYLVIGDDDLGSSGSIEAVFPLAGLAIPAGGFFVGAESTFSLGTADLTRVLNFENGDNVTHLLVQGFSGTFGDDLDTDDDGNLDSEPWTHLLGCVALIDDPQLGEETYCMATAGPDAPNPPGLAARCADGWEVRAFDTASGEDTPRADNNCVLPPPPPPPPPTMAEIFEIQGSGTASPLAGTTAITEDNIVTVVGVDGFFMQTPDARDDGDPDTSNGIFVFTGTTPTVEVGDQVDVTGMVEEFFDFTEITDGPVVSIDSSGNPLPAAVVFDATRPSPDPLLPSCTVEYECYEGMRIVINGGRVCGPNLTFGSDPIAEVYVTAASERCLREPGIEFPGVGGIPIWDGNPEVFELDADKLGLPSITINAGSTFDAEGGLAFEFGDWELWPSALSVTEAPLPAPVPPAKPGEFTIGSLNFFRLFDNIDDPSDLNAAGETRNDAVVDLAEWDARRLKFARYILDVLGAPDVLAVQEVEKLGVLEALAAEITGLDPSVTYTSHLVEGNDIGTIDVGFMVRSTIAVDSVTQLGRDEILTFDGDLLNDRPPLQLDARFIGLERGLVVGFPFAVIVVHQRSLSSIDDVSDGPRVRAKRLEQAQSLAQKAQDLQTNNPGVPFFVVGDFNAFEFSDGYVDVMGQLTGEVVPADNVHSDAVLVSPPLVNLLTRNAGRGALFVQLWRQRPDPRPRFAQRCGGTSCARYRLRPRQFRRRPDPAR